MDDWTYRPTGKGEGGEEKTNRQTGKGKERRKEVVRNGKIGGQMEG